MLKLGAPRSSSLLFVTTSSSQVTHVTYNSQQSGTGSHGPSVGHKPPQGDAQPPPAKHLPLPSRWDLVPQVFPCGIMQQFCHALSRWQAQIYIAL